MKNREGEIFQKGKMAVLDLYINSMRTFPKRKRVKAITNSWAKNLAGFLEQVNTSD